jgi:hypothetical protein
VRRMAAVGMLRARRAQENISPNRGGYAFETAARRSTKPFTVQPPSKCWSSISVFVPGMISPRICLILAQVAIRVEIAQSSSRAS